MTRKLKRSALIGSCLILGLSISIISDSLDWQWTTYRVKDSIEKGDLIISKIKLYHEKNGRYPGQLTELIPDYLDILPLPSAGVNQWYYGVGEDFSFDLCFSMPRDSTWHGYPSCRYDSRYGEWYIDH